MPRRFWFVLVCLVGLPSCSGIVPQRADDGPPGIGIMGSPARSPTSGRPSAQSLPPIERVGDGRARPTYVQPGTGEFLDPPSRPQVEVDAGGQNIMLNFVDTDVQDFVRVAFDEVLKENVVVDAALKGRVTVRTSAPVSRAAAFDLVRQALQASGASLTQSAGVYRVSARSDPKGGRRLGDTVRIVPVRYLSAEEAKAALAPFGQSGVEIAGAANGRYLVMAGAPNDLDNLEQVLATLDVDQMKGMSVGLFPLREAGASSVANELNQMFGKSGDTHGFRSMPITRMNAVLVISPQPNLLTQSRTWIARLDRADQDGRRIYVYPVQNRRAADIAKVLASMLDVGRNPQADAPGRTVAPQLNAVSTFAASKSGATPPLATPALAPPPETDAASDVTSRTQPGGKPQGLRVNADPATNSIVVVATADEWRVVGAALRRLDIMAPQVLIEATIAEVTLNNSLQHGVQWFLQQGNHAVSLSTNTGASTVAPANPGFNYVFGVPQAQVILSALEQVTDVQIVSSPALTVLDNQTARLQVGDQVPVATRSSQSVVSPDAPVVNDIEFKDTGIILAVTPRVNASGLVVLDISQEVSSVVPTTTSNINSPTIQQRRVNSTVAVPSGMEIVLGGLMSVSRNRSNNGIPGLMQVPVVGNLFKSQATLSGQRTELLVILRPTVMGTSADIASVTNEIKARMSETTRLIYQ